MIMFLIRILSGSQCAFGNKFHPRRPILWQFLNTRQHTNEHGHKISSMKLLIHPGHMYVVCRAVILGLVHLLQLILSQKPQETPPMIKLE